MQEIRDQTGEGAGSGGGARLGSALALVGLCLVVYLPGFFSIPPVDRDESRFAQASRQMFESVALPAAARDPGLHGGGLLVPMVQDRARLNKPPLIYWLQAGSAAVFTGGDPLRDAIWMYRVPSLLAAIVAVVLTWRIGAGMFGPSVGLLAGAMLAVCPMVAWEAHQARADVVLLAWTTGAMGAMWAVWSRSSGEGLERGGRDSWSPWWPAAFWVCIAGGVMTKGPITPMVAGLAALGLGLATRRWGWLRGLRPLLGIGIVLLAAGPWVAAVAQKVGWREYGRTIWSETIGRSVSAREGHWGPPGYHLVLLVALFWPGSLLTGWGVVKAWKQARRRRDREEASGPDAAASNAPPAHRNAPLRSRLRLGDPHLFCLAWVVPAWLGFELIGTKLPHYVMPLYPALAIVSAWAVRECRQAAVGVRLGVLLWGLVGLALSAAPAMLILDRVGAASGIRIVADAGAAVLSLVAIGSALNAWRGMFKDAIRFSIAHMAVLAVVLFGVVLPRCRALWVSREVATQLGLLIGEQARPVASVGYQEDSLVFWTRGRLQKIEAAEADRWLAAHPDGVLIRALRPDEPTHARRIIEGLNYSTGKRVRLAVTGPGTAP